MYMSPNSPAVIYDPSHDTRVQRRVGEPTSDILARHVCSLGLSEEGQARSAEGRPVVSSQTSRWDRKWFGDPGRSVYRCGRVTCVEFVSTPAPDDPLGVDGLTAESAS